MSEPIDPYATHLPVLRKLATHLHVRSVLEFGGGLHSTKLFLDRAVFPALDELVTLESSLAWATRLYGEIDDPRWTCVVAPEVMHPRIAPLFGLGFDIALIDGATSAERLHAMLAAQYLAQVLVGHDTEQEYWNAIRPRLVGYYTEHVYDELTPHTSVWVPKGSALSKELANE